MRYTLKKLDSMAKEMEVNGWLGVLLYWQECGYTDMENLFLKEMSKKDIVAVMNACTCMLRFIANYNYSEDSLWAIYTYASNALLKRI